jgi:DNA replication protein DnaC
MSTQDFSRSNALNNIPKKKLLDWLSTIESSTDDLQAKTTKLIAINRYAESNIPIEYWSLKMERDFKGDPRLLAKYNEYISDLKSSYLNGKSICFSGPHGVGKTMAATCILKKASQKGYTCHFSDISNIIATLTQSSNEEKFIAKKELTMVDFLVIDEIDPRFFSSESSSELFIKNFENIFRTRKQNKLPTLICTNSPNIVESFPNNLKQSIGSLFYDGMENICIFSNDYRKIKNAK